MISSMADLSSRMTSLPVCFPRGRSVIPPRGTAGHQLIKEGNTYGY